MDDTIQEIRNIGKAVETLIETNKNTHRMLAFALSLLTDEQMCAYTHHVGGWCGWEGCQHKEEDE